MTNLKTHILQDERSLHRDSAERVVQIAAESIAAHGGFYLSLSGGKTPEGLYRQLATAEFAERIDWSRTHVYFGDERAVPPDHHDSNFRVANDLLLARVPIPGDQVHRIAGEQPADQAAAEYARLLTRTVPLGENNLPCLDLVLLGVGLDGHIASLFPGTDVLMNYKVPVAPVFVEKLQAWRVTLTFPMLNKARHLMLLVASAKKADVVRQALCELPGAHPLPVQMLRPVGEIEWFLEAEAGRHLCRGTDA